MQTMVQNMIDHKESLRKVKQLEAEIRFVTAEKHPAHVMPALIVTLVRVINMSTTPSVALEMAIKQLRELHVLQNKGPAS